MVIASRTEISRDQFAPYEDWFGELRPMVSIAWKLAHIACGVYTDFDGAKRRYNRAETSVAAGMGAWAPSLLEQFIARAR